MKKLYTLLATIMSAMISLNAQLVVKWADPNNYTIETELVDGNYLGPNNRVYFWENGSQHQFVVIHGIDKNYASGQDYNEFYLYVRVTGTQEYSDGQGGTVIGPRVNEDGYPIGIPGFDCCYSSSEYIESLGSSYYGVFYYYGADEFLVGWANTSNGYYGESHCNLSSFFDQTDGFSMASITTGKLVVLQAEDGTMAAQWIMSSGKAGIVIGEGGVSSKIDIPLTSNLLYNDNTGADDEWQYLQLSGTGTGSDNLSYDAAFYIRTDSKTGTFAASDLDLTRTFLYRNGTAIDYTDDVTLTITESSTSIYSLTAVFTGSDGKTYNVTATYEDCPPVASHDNPLEFTWDELYSSVWYAEGSTTVVYTMRWFRNGEQNNSPFVRLAFCFYKSALRYINGEEVPPDGTYTFSTGNSVNQYVRDPSTGRYKYVAVTQISVNTVAAYHWLAFDTDGYNRVQTYSSYSDENGIENYLNSGTVTISTQQDGVHITISARGGTGTSSTNKSFNISIVPNSSSSSTSGYRFTTYVNGRGTVGRSSQDCFYQAGDQITLTPTPEDGWTFSGWTGDCANNITDNHDGTFTYTVPANDCAVIANFTEGTTYTVTFQNYDYDVLQSGTMADGQVPVYNGTTPERPQDERYTYTFTGWFDGTDFYGTEVALPAVTGDVTYVAQYASEQRLYTVTFNNDDNTYLWHGYFVYDVSPSYGGATPTKEANPGFVFRFTGWTDGVNEYPVGEDLPKVTADAVYRAMFVEEPALFTVRFEDPDGNELQTDQLELNAVPAYEGGTPVRENEGDEYNWYEFAFTGWTDGNNTYSPTDVLPAVTADITYTAQYSKKLYIILQEEMDADYYTNFHTKYNGERATTATLNRQFTQSKWATLCLPFDVPAAQLTALSLMNRVFVFKYATGEEQDGLTLYFSQAKSMEAGKGYIVNANAKLAKKESFIFANALINTSIDEQSGFDIANLEGHNSDGSSIYIVGTLRTGTVYASESGSHYMGLKDNKIYSPNSEQGTPVRAYRGIFLNKGEEALPARVRIVAESEDGIIVEELEVVDGNLVEAAAVKKYMENGILYIERSGERYDAQGQRVE